MTTYGRLVEGSHTAEEAYDGLAPVYDDVYLSPKDMAENAWLAGHLDKEGYCDGSVLDVGCGTGLLLDMCTIQPQWYMGIDVSDQMLAVARQKHGCSTFAKASMQDMVSVVGSNRWQNAIYLFGSLSYSTEPMVALEQMEAALRPGGRFFVMLLSHRYPDRSSYSVSNAGYSVPIVTYDEKQATNLFNDTAYLEVESVRGLSVIVDRMQWLGERLMNPYYRFEAATLGRIAPSKAAYVVVEGRRL